MVNTSLKLLFIYNFKNFIFIYLYLIFNSHFNRNKNPLFILLKIYKKTDY